MALKTISMKPTKIKFDNGNSTKIKESTVAEEIPKKSKHIKFDNYDDEDVLEEANNIDSDNTNAVDGEGKKKKHAEKKVPSKKSEKSRKNAMDIGTQWYQEVSFFLISFETADATKKCVYFQFAEYNSNSELVELKNNEIEELTNHCRKCYEDQKVSFEKRT